MKPYLSWSFSHHFGPCFGTILALQARTMPNTPSLVGMGASAYVAWQNTTSKKKGPEKKALYMVGTLW